MAKLHSPDPNSYFVLVHYQEELLRLPRRIAADALDGIPEAYRPAYIEEDDPTKGFRLSTSVADVIRDGTAEIAALEAQMADRKTKHETDLKGERQARINDAVSRACEGAGISKGLVEGAVALMEKRGTFELDESGVVLANTSGTRTSLDGFVGSFLDSDEGAGFRGKRRATPSDGYFTGLLARR